MANQVDGIPDIVLLNCFIGGLTKELQAELIPWHPVDMDQAVSLAKIFEKKHQLSKKG